MEARVATEQYTLIEVGDTIEFVCGSRSQVRKVIEKTEYNSFERMLEHEDKSKCLPGVRDLAEAVAFYHSLPNYERLALEHGVVAFRLAPNA